MKTRKRLIGVILLAMLIITGCDPYDGKRPYDYANTVWLSEQPYLMMQVNADADEFYSEMEIDGEIVKVDILFKAGTSCVVVPHNSVEDDQKYFTGKCKFSKNKCEIRKIKDHKGVLDDSIKKITLVRQD